MNAWRKILDQDILFGKGKNLSGILNIKQVVQYIKSIQTEGGYFDKPSPGIYTTRFCTGILHCIGKRPSRETIGYLKSLQVGTYGFAETTGEMPWIDKSCMALQMYSWFNIKVQNKADVTNFIWGFQNKDGGFGSIINSESDAQTTIHSLRALQYLDSKPNDNKAAIQYLQAMQCNSLWEEYHRAMCLKALGGKAVAFQSRHNPEALGIRERYYHYALRKLQGKDAVCNEMKIYDSAEENYYLARLARLKGDASLNRELFSFARGLELHQGGFPWIPEGVISNGFMIQSLFLLDALDEIDRKVFVKWLISIQGPEGWGSRPGYPEYHEYTVAALIALRLLGVNCETQGILLKAEQEMAQALGYASDNNYFVLRTIKNAMEKMMLCNAKPPCYKIQKKVMNYYLGGGFGSKIPYLYATYWAVRALYLCENYMRHSGRIFLSRIGKIRDDTTSWINSCQNHDGGFGAGLGQPSNIQSTYCAIYSLWMLNSKPGNTFKAIEWIKSLQAQDGGFAGLPGMSSEMLHILYCVGSLAILSER